MSDCTWDLRQKISEYEDATREYKNGEYELGSITVSYWPSVPTGITDFLDDYKYTISSISNDLENLSEKSDSLFERYQRLFGVLDKFYGDTVQVIYQKYVYGQYEEAYSLALQAQKSLNINDDDSLLKEAKNYITNTIYEIRFALFETTRKNDYEFVKALYNDFANNLDCFKKARHERISADLIDQYYTLESKAKTTKLALLNCYFETFGKARDIYHAFKDKTSSAIMKHINIVRDLVDERFVECYSKKMDIELVLDLQAKAKAFPFVLKPKNSILMGKQSTLTEQFYRDNTSKFTPEQFKNNISRNIAKVFQLTKKDNFYNQLIRVSPSLLAIIKPFENDKKLLEVVSAEFLQYLFWSGLLHFTGDIASKFGLQSLPFRVFNDLTRSHIMKEKISTGDISYYVMRVLKKDEYTRKEIKAFTEDEKFAYILNKKYFNNNKVIRISKHIKLPKLRMCLKLAGAKYHDEVLEDIGGTLVTKGFKVKPIHLRATQKIIFVIQQILFGICSILAISKSLNLIGYKVPALSILPSFNPIHYMLISGAFIGLIFLGRSLFSIRQEGRHSISQQKAWMQVDITALVFFVLALAGMILFFTINQSELFVIFALFIIGFGVLYLPANLVHPFNSIDYVFYKRNAIRFINFAILVALIIMVVVTIFK